MPYLEAGRELPSGFHVPLYAEGEAVVVATDAVWT
jgi:hypothetical protein